MLARLIHRCDRRIRGDFDVFAFFVNRHKGGLSRRQSRITTALQAAEHGLFDIDTGYLHRHGQVSAPFHSG